MSVPCAGKLTPADGSGIAVTTHVETHLRPSNDHEFNPRGFARQGFRMPGNEMKAGGDQPPLAGEASAGRGAASPAGFKPLLGGLVADYGNGSAAHAHL